MQILLTNATDLKKLMFDSPKKEFKKLLAIYLIKHKFLFN